MHLKVVDSFKYLGIPIDKELTMSSLHTLTLDNIKESNGKLHGLLRDVKSNRELHSSHHSNLGRARTSPKTLCNLWKSCVLVHATQYLRYIHSPTQFHEIQTELNKSLHFSVVPDYLILFKQIWESHPWCITIWSSLQARISGWQTYIRTPSQANFMPSESTTFEPSITLIWRTDLCKDVKLSSPVGPLQTRSPIQNT